MEDHIEKLKRELANGVAQIFDVREKSEWDEGHLKCASLVPLGELNVGLEPEDKNKNVKTYLYCHSGRRVMTAQPILEDMGFKEVIPLLEGFDELAELGFEVEVEG